MLLFYQVATRLSLTNLLTNCWNAGRYQQLVTSLLSSTTLQQVVNKPLRTCQQAGNKQCKHILLTSCWNRLLQVCCRFVTICAFLRVYTSENFILIHFSSFPGCLTQTYLDLLLIFPTISTIDAIATYCIPCGSQISPISLVFLSMARHGQQWSVDHRSLFQVLCDRAKYIQKNKLLQSLICMLRDW